MDRLNYINSGNAAFIDSLYDAYKQDPASVDFGWQKFFEGFDFGRGAEAPVVSAETPDHFLKEINVLNLIDGYRGRGHLFADTNPVRERRKYFPGKELETFGLSDADLDTVFNAGVELGI
ncbi:MAG: 2-oxoglutarate dehydrogenase E1 subunit family protein, partial [Mucilaginibacter sp.]